MAKMNGVKGWLKSSYTTHGNSTDGSSKPKSRNMDDTPKGKVRAVASKTTDMQKTSTVGNKSGGGKSSQRTTSKGNGGNTKWIAGIESSRKQ